MGFKAGNLLRNTQFQLKLQAALCVGGRAATAPTAERALVFRYSSSSAFPQEQLMSSVEEILKKKNLKAEGKRCSQAVDTAREHGFISSGFVVVLTCFIRNYHLEMSKKSILIAWKWFCSKGDSATERKPGPQRSTRAPRSE